MASISDVTLRAIEVFRDDLHAEIDIRFKELIEKLVNPLLESMTETINELRNENASLKSQLEKVSKAKKHVTFAPTPVDDDMLSLEPPAKPVRKLSDHPAPPKKKPPPPPKSKPPVKTAEVFEVKTPVVKTAEEKTVEVKTPVVKTTEVETLEVKTPVVFEEKTVEVKTAVMKTPKTTEEVDPLQKELDLIKMRRSYDVEVHISTNAGVKTAYVHSGSKEYQFIINDQFLSELSRLSGMNRYALSSEKLFKDKIKTYHSVLAEKHVKK